MRLRYQLLAGFTVLIATGCASGGLNRDNQWARQASRYLDTAYDRLLADQGFIPTGQVFEGSLNGSESESRDIRLEGRTSYAILAACDNDCSDIDLYINDSSGEEIDSDVATDDFPILRFSTRRTGDYRLRVRMYACSSEPCFYAVGIYRRDRR